MATAPTELVRRGLNSRRVDGHWSPKFRRFRTRATLPRPIFRSIWKLARAPARGPRRRGRDRLDGLSGTYYQLYTDERDVQRVYEMSLDAGVWRLWRDGAPFSQRFTGTLSENGKTITGRWEIAEDGKTWKTDFDLL